MRRHGSALAAGSTSQPYVVACALSLIGGNGNSMRRKRSSSIGVMARIGSNGVISQRISAL